MPQFPKPLPNTDAGAGAAYLSGGLGIAEFAFCAFITFLAYRGLDNYRYIAIGWVLHTCWDLAHHYHGNPIIIFDPTSSIGCAICDLGLAAYYAIGAPAIVRNAAIQKQASCCAPDELAAGAGGAPQIGSTADTSHHQH